MPMIIRNNCLKVDTFGFGWFSPQVSLPSGRDVFYRGLKYDETVKSSKKDDFVKCSRYGLRILRNEAYLQYAAMTKDDA